MEKETYAVARTRGKTGEVTELRLSPYAMFLTQTTRLNMLPLAAEVLTIQNEHEIKYVNKPTGGGGGER